jgi:hypothetical protein
LSTPPGEITGVWAKAMSPQVNRPATRDRTM